MSDFPWYDEPRPQGPLCEADGTRENADGYEFYWNCANLGVVDVGRTLLCEDHAGELGYGPKQAEYGFDPHDGLNPTPGPEPVARTERADTNQEG